MSRKKTLSRGKKLALLAGTAALVGGTAVVMTGTSQASVACDGLATALRNNEQFIAGQRANPDAQSGARIANRQAVVEEIKRKQAAGGCAVGEGSAAAGGNADADGGGAQAAPPAEAAPPPADAAQPPAAGGGGGGGGDVVCAGSTVTLSGEGGAPAASSGEFPAGTRLKVTNLDNDKSTTVEVTSASGSCVLLNNAAFEQVREPGKFLIRNARIERVG
ncbi:hypothetical protein [Streptomyces sp. TRM64462]|uniref:hypothetical protein n=1 Tax=Streptomyces sp. TRM64462 TaxID=2741726 RepID=UPI001585F48A|nr:hypothetical protein [Streptomyces sp. TRM64462]